MKKFISLFTTISIVLGILGAFSVFAEETAADFEISTLEELEAFRDDVNNGSSYEGKTVKLTADIDMSEKYGEGKESWEPIGTLSWQAEVNNLFRGTFDGNGHKIQNLYICKSSENIGLFCVNAGTIENLEIASGTVMGTRCVGGVVGYNEGTVENCHNAIPVAYVGTSRVHSFGGIVGYNGGGGTIKNCRNSGNILGGGIVGGIVGWGPNGIVENCRNTGNVQATRSTASMVGGIIGLSNGKVKACSNRGNIGNDGNNVVGGIAGFSADNVNSEAGVVENCYNTGDVFGDSEVGGIVGQNGIVSDEGVEGLIKNCYNTGVISGKSYVGGIFGCLDIRDVAEKIIVAKLQNCYNIGTVSGTEYTDGISAVDEGYVEITSCYYLDACISGEQSETTVLTTEQFADKTNFTNWNFDTVWEMDATLGRPVLRSNTEEPPTQLHTHKICGDANCTDNHEDIEWTAWDSADALPTEAGNYYLTKDVEILRTWNPADGTALCLNGHSVRQTNKQCVIRPKGVFSLCDCADGGAVTGGMLGVEIADKGSVFNMYGGKITENHLAGGVYDGGGVVCYTGGIFNMYGGEISSNSSDSIGGVKMYGQMSVGGKAVIKDNTDAGGGAGNLFLSSNSTVTVASSLTDGAYISIAYYSALNKIPKTITGGNDADYSKYFHSDNETYKVVNSENNALRLVYKNDSYPYYEIKDVFAEDGERNTLTAIPTNTEFTAYAYLEQIAALEVTNYGTVIIAAYDERGTLIDVGVEEINPEYLPCSYTVPMCSEDRSVGSIKAFIWDGVNSMTPLAETKARAFEEQ